MGLFDSVYIDRPDLGINPMTEWQTKDLDEMWCRRLDITSEGRLILHDVEFETIPENERPELWSPILREKSKTLRDLDYHGILRLHNCDTGLVWDAKFTDGVMASLTPRSE